jgi:hypothetical protein
MFFKKHTAIEKAVKTKLKLLILSIFVCCLVLSSNVFLSRASEVSDLMRILEDANVITFTEAERANIEKGSRKTAGRLKELERKIKKVVRPKSHKTGSSSELKKLEEVIFGSEKEEKENNEALEIEKIQEKIDENNKKIKNLISALESGNDPGGYINERLTALLSENKLLIKEKRKLEKALEETEEEEPEGLLARIEELEEGSGLELGGSFEFILMGHEKENTSFEAGKFELTVEAELSENISFGGAIEVEGGEVGMAEAIVDVGVFGDYAGVQIGLMDIPFGSGAEVEAVNDSLTKEMMMDGDFSDLGVNIYGELSILNYNLFVGNGMGEDGGVPVSQDHDNNNTKTPCGRIGVSLIDGLEVGASYLKGTYIEDNNEEYMQRIGVDVCFAFDPFKITEDAVVVMGEYIIAEEEFEGDLNKHEGYYAQVSSYFTDKYYGIFRYGIWQPDYDVDGDDQDNDELKQVTAGLGYNVSESLLMRLEYLHPIEDSSVEVENDSVVLQADISF